MLDPRNGSFSQFGPRKCPAPTYAPHSVAVWPLPIFPVSESPRPLQINNTLEDPIVHQLSCPVSSMNTLVQDPLWFAVVSFLAMNTEHSGQMLKPALNKSENSTLLFSHQLNRAHSLSTYYRYEDKR